MSNTYSQLYVHCVFAPKYRSALLLPHFDERLRQYITAIIQRRGHKMLAINNVEDHLHLLFGWAPKESLSSIMEAVKGDSSKWINTQDFLPRKFNWQSGYGAFSHSRSQIDGVVKYIMNQQEHHKRETFLEEYRRVLTNNGVEFDEQYLFREPCEDD